MRRILMAALATAAVGIAATPAGAVTLQLCTSGASCVSGTTNVNLQGNVDSPGQTTIKGNVGPSTGPVVDFTSTDGLLEDNQGDATIFRDTPKTNLLDQLTFTLETGAFTEAEFNLEQGTPKAFDVVLSVANCIIGPCTETIHVDNSSGSNVFDIIGGAGESFTTASINTTGGNTDGGFQTFKQLRLVMADSVTAVPEPGTWGLMLLGFGGIGMAMRRRRRELGALMQVA
jgi:hypothetical protein